MGSQILRRGNISNDESAVSEVISTVIIVAVTIAIAIAVSYWMGGLVAIFTRFEKIEVKSAFVVKINSQYNISIRYINTGASATSIDLITINGVPTASYTTPLTLGGAFVIDITCPTGVTREGWITFIDGARDPSNNILTGGVTAIIGLHTTGGKDYYTSVTLP